MPKPTLMTPTAIAIALATGVAVGTDAPTAEPIEFDSGKGLLRMIQRPAVSATGIASTQAQHVTRLAIQRASSNDVAPLRRVGRCARNSPLG